MVLGGIEASMRRLTHYDYWQDRLRPSILYDSGADMIIYGMGERGIVELCSMLSSGGTMIDARRLQQTVHVVKANELPDGRRPDDIVLHSHERCLADKRCEAENYRHIEEESNKMHACRLLQETGNRITVVNPPYPPMSTEELDASFAYPVAPPQIQRQAHSSL